MSADFDTMEEAGERTREDILAAATREFSDHGFAGARVDAIAASTATSKRAIYHHFGGKKGLYLAVLERAYARMRAADVTDEIERMPPEEAMTRLVEATFDYHDANPDFIRLVSIENIHRATFLKASRTVARDNTSIIAHIETITAMGVAAGVFARHPPAADIHLLISCLSFFRVSNRHTFEALFRTDMSAPDTRARHRRMATEAVLAYLRTPEDVAAT